MIFSFSKKLTFCSIILFLSLCNLSWSTADEATPGFYEPIEKNVEGWTIKLDPQLENEENKELGKKALTALANHLQRIKYILPEKKVTELQKLSIWVEKDNQNLGNMQYHPDAGWLKRNGHNPKLVKHVHVPRAASLINRGTWAKHPYVILHELAHAYHDQVLSFEHPEVKAAYDQAKAEGVYERVMSHTGRKVKHYALTNHKEYFAESTEAYLGMNDFYPFVRAELKEYDPRMYKTLEEIWGPVR